MDIPRSIIPQDYEKLIETTGNIYEAINIIAKRAKQIEVERKMALDEELEALYEENEEGEEIVDSDTRIEVVRYFEQLPKPHLVATHEFLNDKLTWRYREDEEILAKEEGPAA